MEAFDPHTRSKALRRFKPTRKRAGVFSLATCVLDASLLICAFFLVLSPMVLQPGVNVTLPQTTSFSGGARLGSMVLSIPKGGGYYFNDVRVDLDGLMKELKAAAVARPDAPLIIEADRSIVLETVIAAMDAAVEAGIPEVSIATEIAAVDEAAVP